MIDVASIRNQFPILHQQVNGFPLVYFDNAATTQKPKRVIDSLIHHYTNDNANIHRSIHKLAERSTVAFEQTRTSVQRFINAKHSSEIIFVRGATEGINLVAYTYGRSKLKAGDEIIISEMEHHSNIVPWQMLCEEKGCKLKVIPITPNGNLDLVVFEKLLSKSTKIVALTHASNTLGTINPIQDIIKKAHSVNAIVLIDGAQISPHYDIDVQQLDCDFYTISAHKMYGPTGVGVLFGKKNLLEEMPPFMGGGEMINEVTIKKTTYNSIPYKFEAGTPNVADVVAFKSAIEFVEEIGKKNIASYEQNLLDYATEKLSKLKGLILVGTAEKKVSLQSFVIEGIHNFDVGQLLDAKGIAVRTGHHCTQPLMDALKVEGTIRVSFGVYNTIEEIDQMIVSLENIITRMS